MAEGFSGRIRLVGRFGHFAGQVLWRTVTPRWELHETARQISLVVMRCALPVMAVVFPCGMVLALQGLHIFDLFGAQRLLSPLVSVAIFREIAPVLASVLVCAQGGSAFAAELGSMRIKEELDATTIMAIDPLRVHVVPRFVAAVLATPMLNLLACGSGVLGGYTTAVVLRGEPAGIFWANFLDLTTPNDLFGSMIKTLVFGAIIGLVSGFYGYNTTGGAAGVGRSVNDTVVVACTTFIVVNYFLTTLLFGVIG